MNNLEEFLSILNENIKKILSIIEVLEKIKADLIEGQEDKLKLKTGGTILSTVGTACTVAGVALAPFTGGFSLFATAMGGVTASVAGGALNIGTDYFYSQFQKEQLEKLKEYVSQLEKIGKQLDEKLSTYDSSLNHLVNDHYDQDTALDIILNSLKENLLSLLASPHLFLFAAQAGSSHRVRLTNSQKALDDFVNCDGFIVKDIIRNKIVMNYDKSNKTLVKEPGIETFFEVNLTALTGTLGCITVLDTLDKVTTAALSAGKLGAASTGEILKTVQISAKEAATFAKAGADVSTTAAKTGVSTAGKILSVATVGVSVALTVYEIGSLISQFGEKNLLAEEVQKVIDFCIQKREILQKLKQQIRTHTDEDDDDDEYCKCRNIKLKVLYFNARSINDARYSQEKIGKMRELLFLHTPNIVAINETWLTPENEDNSIENLLSLAGYAVYRQDRNIGCASTVFDFPMQEVRRGGGLLVAFRPPIDSKFEFSRFSHLDYKDNLIHFLGHYNYMCNRCRRNTTKTFFKFGFILGYRPPGLSSQEDKMLIETMNDNCAKIMNSHDAFAFVADFNCGSAGVDSLGFEGYSHTNFPSTHVSGKGLDQIVYTNSQFVNDAHVIDRVSDHNAIIFNLNIGKDYTQMLRCKAKTCT